MADEKNFEPSLASFGWAPGGYSFMCVDCSPEENKRLQHERWAEKRAWRCEHHAQEKLDEALENRESAPAAGAPETAVDGDRLVTITIGIGRNGDIHEDTQCHGNAWPEVYRGMAAVRERINELIDRRRECPYIPRNKS